MKTLINKGVWLKKGFLAGILFVVMCFLAVPAFAAAPAITTIFPTSGAPGDQVELFGSGFGGTQGTSEVAFTSATNVITPITFDQSKGDIWSNSVTPNQIWCRVPDGLAPGNYQVKVTVYGQSSNAMTYTVSAPGLPTVTGVSPSSGLSPNAGIAITGTNFTNIQSIMVGSTPITGYTVSSSTLINGISIPSGLSVGTAYDIRVTTLAGQSPINAPGDQYKVLSTATPSVMLTTVAPPSRVSGDQIVLFGSGFGGTQGTSEVTFTSATNVATPITFDKSKGDIWSNSVTPNQIWCRIPDGLADGNYQIKVKVNGQSSNAMTYTIDSYDISSVAPSAGLAGDTVTITGTGMKNIPVGSRSIAANNVIFQDTGLKNKCQVADADVTSWTDTQIVCKVPAAVSPGKMQVQVTSANSIASTYVFFQVNPNISALTPSSGSVGTAVTINGTTFGPDPGSGNRSSLSHNVKFGTIQLSEANITSWSNTTIQCVVPAGVSVGNAVVTVTANWATSSATNFGGNFNVKSPVQSGQPAILYISPNICDQGSTLTGAKIVGANTHFGSSTTVDLGTGITVSNIVASSDGTNLTCNIAIGASAALGPRNVVVTTGSETVTGTNEFTVNTAGAPYFVSITPNNGDKGATLTGVAIVGAFTHFGSSSTVDMGPGITVSNVAASSATNLTCNISIDASTSGGTRNVVVSTGTSEVVPGNNAFTVNGSLGGPAAVVASEAPISGPFAAAPFTTYVNITGTGFGNGQGSSTVAFGATAAGTPELWTDTRIVMPVPSGMTAGPSVPVTVTVNGSPSNSDKTFTPITGKMIDNYENTTSMYDIFNSDAKNAGEVTIATPEATPEAYYDGLNSMKSVYPGSTNPSQWGGYWGKALKSTVQPFDLTSCNMFVFRLKGDGSANTIQLSVLESGAKAEPYVSLDKYSLSDNSGFQEVKIPFSRLWRNDYPSSVKDDDVFSKSIQNYSFNYYGTNTNSNYNYIDFVTAVAWTGPIIDQIGPNSGPGNTPITITGSGFGNTKGATDEVTINGVPVVPTSWTDKKIVVPAGTASGPVVVTVGGQTSNGVPFTVSSAPVPTIISIIPSSEPSGSAGISVKITGSNFGNDPLDPLHSDISNRDMASYHVMFGTTNVPAANVTAWSSTEIDVNVPTLSDGIYPVQVTASNDASNLFDFTVGTVITGPVTNISITREADAVGSNIGLGWTCSTGNVDIYTLTGTFETTPATWTKEFTNVSGSSQIDSSVAGKVASGTNKWYKIVPTGATLATGDLTLEVLGKFDIQCTSGNYALISLPVIPSATDINVVIGNQLTGAAIQMTADKLLAYNGTTYGLYWLKNGSGWMKGSTSTTEAILADNAYWIYVNAANPTKNISIVGKIPTTARSISIAGPGNYTLVGSSFPMTVTLNNSNLFQSGATAATLQFSAAKILSYNGTTYDTAWLYSNAGNTWYTGSSPTTITLSPGKGYWIYQPSAGNAYTWNYKKPY